MSEAVISFNLFGHELALNPTTHFSVFGFTVYWYGVIIAVGLLLAILYAMKMSSKFGITEDNIVDMILIVVPLGIIGARILYVMFNWDVFKDNFMSVFKIWEGGLAIYGGIALAIAGLFVYAKVKKLPLSVFLDVGGLALLIAQSIGRWGNFINREVYGCTTTLPWAMTFSLNGASVSVHPLFLYESLWNAIGFVILHLYSKKRRFDGEIFALYMMWYGIARFFLEQLRDESVLYFFGTNIRVSEVIGIFTFVVAGAYILFRFITKKTNPELLYVNIKAKEMQKKEKDEETSAENAGKKEND